jgi:hypothetical protein
MATISEAKVSLADQLSDQISYHLPQSAIICDFLRLRFASVWER